MTASWQLEFAILADALAAVTAARMQPDARRRFWAAVRAEVSRRRAAALKAWGA